jgi:penicillin-binding protein A
VTRQIRYLAMAMLALYGALFLKLNQVQVLQASALSNDPRNSRVATRDFSRPRGVIQTADGTVIAKSVPTDDQFKRLRQYPTGNLYSQVSGYFSFTFPPTGVEQAYSAYLSGRKTATSLRGLANVFANREVTGNVTLTLRNSVQQVAAQQLGNRKGAVVALDPTTGAILALWSFPSYDPNPLASHDQTVVRAAGAALKNNPDKPDLSRAYGERYAPGSTFKLITASAALVRKPELTTKSYPVLSRLKLPHTTADLVNFGGETCGGTLPNLLRVSCNTGFGQMGLDLGADALAGEAADYGFNEQPPLDIRVPAATRSQFPPATAFIRDDPTLAQSAIGQHDVSASPLQMALVAAGIANKGVIMKPHVMAEVRDSEGNVVTTYRPEAWKQAIPADAAAALTQMMIGVVQSGTATRMAIPGVQVAGKTGTAQTVGPHSHAWIVGFAPADAPKVAVAVIVESQPGLGDTVTGGLIAAPIAKAVLQAALAAP